jgi:hypothetical protein
MLPDAMPLLAGDSVDTPIPIYAALICLSTEFCASAVVHSVVVGRLLQVGGYPPVPSRKFFCVLVKSAL